MRRQLTVPILLTMIVSVPLVMFFRQANLLPVLASYQGASVDRFMRWLFIIGSVIFSLVAVFLIYSLVVFRRQPDDVADAAPIHGNVTLEVAWTVVPLIIVLSLGVAGTGALFSVTRPHPDELVVDVTAFQWAWRFEYPDLGVTSSELVLPVGQPVLFRLHSEDVIHSFWVPEFRMKMDNVPGKVNEVRHTPIRIGEYKVRCAEMCGTGHAAMLASVKVVSEAEFQEWVAARTGQAAPEVPSGDELSEAAARGREYAQQFGCVGCHSTDGSSLVGPTWKGLFGSTRALEDGTTVTADENYLYNSIVDPGSQVVEGFMDVMPKTFAEQLTDQQIQDLIEYIKALK